MKIFISTLSGRVYGGASYFQNLIPEIIRQDNHNLYYIWINKENKSLLRIKTKNITFYKIVNKKYNNDPKQISKQIRPFETSVWNN